LVPVNTQLAQKANEIYQKIHEATVEATGKKVTRLKNVRLLIMFAWGENGKWHELSIGIGKLSEIWEAFTRYMTDRYMEMLKGRVQYIE
jgi:hypothetical protein